MKTNRGKIKATAVICRDEMQRFVLQTLLRIAQRQNVKAVVNADEALAFVVSH
jgi:hypothetical protein